MTHHLVITAVGTDRPGISYHITKLVTQSGCNIIDSRLALFGDEFSLIMLISGSISAITRVETLMPEMSQTHDLMTIMKRTNAHSTVNFSHKIELSVISCDDQGIAEKLTQLCESFEINIAELSATTQIYHVEDQSLQALAPKLQVGDNLFEMMIVAHAIAPDTLLIKQAFDKLCAELNAKGTLEFSPV
ncbi:MAG: ACT domain-containing protein [Vibrio sp.]